VSLASRVLGLSCACAIATASVTAQANSRYPESNQIVFAQHDPDLVLLRVTFGLLVSHDRGRTFDWVCEESIGFSGIEDPMYTVTPSNAYVGTTFQGLTVTRDNACGWSFVEGDLTSQVFIDLAPNPNDAKNIVVFASSYDHQDEAGNILFTSKLWETKDEAQTFEQLGDKLDPALLGHTLDLTKTDPNRIYLTALRNPGTQPNAFLLTSKDHGKTWEEQEIPLEEGERAIYIAAVDPNDAERVYIRTYNSVDKPTRLLVRDAPEGGPPTIRTVYNAQGALLGFALTPDGSKVFIGGPKDGIRVASTTDFAFEQRSKIEVQCLAVSQDGLWACSNEQNGFVAGLSQDEGVTFEPRLHFCDIRGPLTCAQGTSTNDRCSQRWPLQKAALGCGGLPEGSSSGGPFDAGGGFPAEPNGGSNSGNGCGCRAAPAGPWGAIAVVAGMALALLRRARPKR
jgi:hypothetical protein